MSCHAFSSLACSRNKAPKERNLLGRSREIEFAGVIKRHSAALGDHRVRADEVIPLRLSLIATLTTPLDLPLFSFARHALPLHELKTEYNSVHHSVHRLISNLIFYLSLSAPHH